jgi:O-antigen/teichoic acid export membrane protein
MTRTAAATVGRARASRDILGQLVFKAANLVLGVVVTILIVRVLGDEGFGQWSTLFAVSTIVGYFGNMGIERIAVERAAAQPEREAEWVGALVSLRLAMSVPAALGSLAVLLVLADGGEMRTAAVLISSSLLVTSLTSARVVFQLRVRNTLNTALELGNGIVWGLVVVVAFVAGTSGLVEIAAGFTVVWALTSVAYYVLAVRVAPIRFAGAHRLWGPLVRLGVPIGIGSLLVLGYGYIGQVIVFEIAGAREAGLYGSVTRIYDRIQFLPQAMMTTLFPIIVAARDADPARVRRVVHLAVDYLLMGSLPAVTITLAGPEPIVRLLFGAEFAEAAPALPILMATFTMVSLGYLAGYLIITYGLQRQFIAFAAAALLFNVGLNLALVPTMGFMGAAWSTLSTEILVNGLAWWAVSRKMGFVPRGRNVLRTVVAAIAVGVLGYALRTIGLPVLVWAPAAILAYPVILLALGVLDVDEIRALRSHRSVNALDR